jgi:hypothetical protein
VSRLSDDDLIQIQTFIDRAKNELDHRGLTLEVDSDLSNWVALIKNAPGKLVIASTHDPRSSYVHPGNSFWIIIRERDRRFMDRLLRRDRPIIACLCHKVIETENIAEEIRTHRLFFDRKPILDYRPVDIVLGDNTPVIGGKVGLAGGFWVHPKYRGTKLSNIVSRVTRVLSLRHFDIDWSISLVRDTPRRKAMIHNTYGLAHSASITRGFYPPYGYDLDMQMSYMHRDEILEQVRAENASEGGAEDRSSPSPAAPETPELTPRRSVH